MPQSFGSLHFHLVFSTKNRQPLIDEDLQTRLYEYMGASFTRRNRSCLPLEECLTTFISWYP